MSLHDWNILRNTKEFLGLGNYAKAFGDESVCAGTLQYPCVYHLLSYRAWS